MLPNELISSLKGVPGFDEDGFIAAHHQSDPPVSIRVNSRKWKPGKTAFPTEVPVPWCDHGYYLASRPVFTLDPLWHAGLYYVQEASSMFLGQAIRRVMAEIPVKRVLDLCAAPGGKSTHLLNMLPSDAMLVCNEVVGTRTDILLENVVKWGNANVVVTQNDPAMLGRFEGVFDLVVVDAPCSGSGLFRRDHGAIQEWSLHHVAHCCQRQQRILADIVPALAPGGFMVYSTCSYSAEENEGIADWLVNDFNMEPVGLDWPDGAHGVVVSRSPKSLAPCYRFYPGMVQGEGFFLAVLRKKGKYLHEALSMKHASSGQPNLKQNFSEWVDTSDPIVFYAHKETMYGMTEEVYRFFGFADKKLYIRKAGVRLGETMQGTVKPHHELALSGLWNRGRISMMPLGHEQAIRYLRKESFDLPAEASKGWQLVGYHDYPLGWIKNIGTRFNNYYPSEWRIRMFV